MIKLFFTRMREKEDRRQFGLLLGAKLVGVGLALGLGYWITTLIGSEAGASTIGKAAVKVTDQVSAVNTVWVLVTAFLVFFMQAGFMFLESGFARQRETVNVLLECIVDTCLCGLLFWAFGFAFMFGAGNGWIGHQYYFLNGAPNAYGTTGVSFMAFFLFQYAFADTCSTVTSGAMVGRTGFVGDLLYSIGVSGFIYPILGHWVWGPGGWLATMGSKGGYFASLGQGFHDFAGSTVVHSVGGFISLAGAIVLGPRLGRKFKRDGGGMPPGHDLTIAALGGVFLWFGWYGFNPGSTLSALDWEGIGRIATNTTLAACAAGLTAMFVVYPRLKKWDLGISINGFLAGLVAITCPCYWVNAFGSVAIGAVAGVVVVIGVDLLEHWRIDDPIGAWPVHGLAGIWGTLSLGLFACGKYGVPGPTGADNSAPLKGLFWGGGGRILAAQTIGSLVMCVAAFGIAMLLMYLVKLTKTLRISEAGELEGIDVHEHGSPAYHPEFGGPGGYVDMTTITASVSPLAGKDKIDA
jgi:ammonium transporter, Amt family